ncbi:hypothetical protein RA28_21765 [Ruegeria sp. ANG-S4]|uniref:hypothetical protein n=1 Tax=Ruegeria sp. ANG-S4 TaxID=1577904 RepID=UPI00057FF455|nr:hypothetical protein [Ruegeria sp. ANG-S4]KIC41001.1 hypothetical protein RA28_21765 [Ruegeria sp. ANG-S4]
MGLFYGVLFSLFTAAIVIAGDLFIKVAADGARPITSPPMVAGIVLYAVSAVLWYFAMRHIPLGQAAVAYSMLSLIVLCGAGWAFFGEHIGLREAAGVACACLAMVLMMRIA